MKTKCILFLSAFLIGFGVFAQNSNCNATLSLFSGKAQIKDWEGAKPLYLQLVKECPSANLAVYQYGAMMYKDFLEKGDSANTKETALALIENYKKRLQYFPTKTKKGETLAMIAQVMFDNGIGTKEEQYAAFEKAWTTDEATFESPKSLYAYFSLLVDLHDEGKKDLQEVFAKYDQVMSKIETLENSKAEIAAPLMEKQDGGEELTAKEKKILGNSEIYLSNYSIIKGSINGKLGQRADCENLIPLFEKQFEAKKGDIAWLRIASGRLYAKECTDSPLFVKLVEAQHRLEPSAKSALYLGKLAEESGNSSKAMEYYNESAQLEENPSDRAKVYYVIATNYKKKGSFGSARTFYKKALQQKPSMGAAYLQIANMYATSANDCGNTTFEKRAVYWLAAEYANRAGRVDPSLQKHANQAAASYNAKAPQKSDIFQSGKAGQTVSIGCWIGESVRVPNL